MDELRLRPVTVEDLESLVEFFAAPHVARWWHQDASLEAVTEKYAAAIDETVRLLVLLDERPVGMAQWYLWSVDDAAPYGVPPGTVGFDYLLGFPRDCDRGLGTRLIAALLTEFPALDVWVTPEEANGPSCRVLEKNGFDRMAVKQCDVPGEPWAGPTAIYRLQRSAMMEG